MENNTKIFLQKLQKSQPEAFQGVDLDAYEQELRKDPNARKELYQQVKDNTEGFDYTEDDFYGKVGLAEVKKKDLPNASGGTYKTSTQGVGGSVTEFIPNEGGLPAPPNPIEQYKATTDNLGNPIQVAPPKPLYQAPKPFGDKAVVDVARRDMLSEIKRSNEADRVDRQVKLDVNDYQIKQAENDYKAQNNPYKNTPLGSALKTEFFDELGDEGVNEVAKELENIHKTDPDYYTSLTEDLNTGLLEPQDKHKLLTTVLNKSLSEKQNELSYLKQTIENKEKAGRVKEAEALKTTFEKQLSTYDKQLKAYKAVDNSKKFPEIQRIKKNAQEHQKYIDTAWKKGEILPQIAEVGRNMYSSFVGDILNTTASAFETTGGKSLARRVNNLADRRSADFSTYNRPVFEDRKVVYDKQGTKYLVNEETGAIYDKDNIAVETDENKANELYDLAKKTNKTVSYNPQAANRHG